VLISSVMLIRFRKFCPQMLFTSTMISHPLCLLYYETLCCTLHNYHHLTTYFFKLNFFYLSHCRCTRLVLHLITHTLGRTPLDEWSVSHRGLYLHDTTNTRDKYRSPSAILFCRSPLLSILYTYILCTHVTYAPTIHNTTIHAQGAIRTRDPNNQAISNFRFSLHGHRDRHPHLLIVRKEFLMLVRPLYPVRRDTLLHLSTCFHTHASVTVSNACSKR
jgi:hypothetical protein